MSVSGEWKLTVHSEFTPDPFILYLDEGKDGGSVTGSMALKDHPEAKVPITDGQLEESSISWKVKLQGHTASFSGTVDGDQITGDVSVSILNFKFDAARVTVGVA